MSINNSLLGITYFTQIKEEGTFQTNTMELYRPPGCDIKEHGYAKN